MNKRKSNGRMAFEAYEDVRRPVSHPGRRAWRDLPKDEKKAWRASAGAAIEHHEAARASYEPIFPMVDFEGEPMVRREGAPVRLVPPSTLHSTGDSVPDGVNHPAHYGGKDNPYEAIKVIEAHGWGIPFCLACIVKYAIRAGQKDGEDVRKELHKISWYALEAARMAGGES